MTLSQALHKFGAVTVPDLPGLGGMSSFYSIGAQPTIENYASYLAAFIELRFHRKRRIVVVTIGEGSAFVTRLLQNHAKAADRIDSVISIGGILHHSDVPRSKWNRLLLSASFRLLSAHSIAWFLNRLRFAWLIKATHAAKSQNNFNRQLDVELWQQTELRTYFNLKRQLLSLDLCNQKIHKPFRLVWANLPSHVDLRIVEQHALVVYQRVNQFIPKLTLRGWHDLADTAYLEKALGSKLRTWL